MLLSMTGFGEAFAQRDGLSVSVEVRAVNNRYFKLSVRSAEGYASLEPRIESEIRKQVRRGTVTVSLRVDRERSADDYAVDRQVLDLYRRQLLATRRAWGLSDEVLPEALLMLPGVVQEDVAEHVDADAEWPLVRETLKTAMGAFEQMRQEEGRAMAADLLANCAEIQSQLDAIRQRAPLVVSGYRTRLEERVRKALEDFNVTLDPSELIREVSVFTERSDISEEIVRLQSHLEQFAGIVDGADSSGRRLEFVVQEMFRETNTIGSKANDVEIAQHVIEIKTMIERLREMIQNVE